MQEQIELDFLKFQIFKRIIELLLLKIDFREIETKKKMDIKNSRFSSKMLKKLSKMKNQKLMMKGQHVRR